MMKPSSRFLGRGWHDLTPDNHAAICACLTLKTRAVAAQCSKGLRSAVQRSVIIHPEIEDAKLPLKEGMAFSNMMDILRLGAIHFDVAAGASSSTQAITDGRQLQNLRSSPQGLKDLLILNGAVFSNWLRVPSGEAGVYSFLQDVNKMNPGMFDKMEIERVRYWPQQRLFGTFYVLLDRPDGAIMIPEDLSQVYLVKGLAQSVADVIGQRRLPWMVRTTLLPVAGRYIAYDGVMLTAEVTITAERRKELLAIYAHAVEKQTIRATTPVEFMPPKNAAAGKSVACDKVSVSTVRLDVSDVSRKHSALLERLARAPKVPLPAGVWVFRRWDYSEQTNPNHIVQIMSGIGMAIHMDMCKALLPTVDELMVMIEKSVFHNDGGGWKSNTAPSTISIDAIEVYEVMKEVLKTTGIEVDYYPPPSAEETALSTFEPIGDHCKLCHATPGPGVSLARCTRCKRVLYCCKEHQRIHWREHKPVCIPPA